MAFNIEVFLNLVDRLSGPLRGPLDRLQQLQDQALRTQRGMEQMGAGASAVIAGAAIAAPIVLATQKAMELETAMTGFNKIANLPATGVKEYVKDFQDLSGQVKMSTVDIANMATFGVQAGLAKTRTEILDFARDAGEMGVSFGMSATDAGSSLSGLRTIFNLTQTDARLLGDAMNHIGNNMDALPRDIIKIQQNIGSLAKSVGLTAQQNAALAATFLNLKTQPDVASNAMKTLYGVLNSAPSQSKEFQTALKSIGYSAVELKHDLGQDAQGTITKFIATLSKVDKAQQSTIAESLFGREFYDDILKVVNATGLYNKALGLVGNKAAYAGSMHQEFLSVTSTAAYSFKSWQDSVDNLQQSLGTVLLPTITRLVDKTTEIINKIRKWVDAHPQLTNALVYTAVGVAVLTTAIGGAIFSLGMFNFMWGNASAGLILFRGGLSRISTSVTAVIQNLVRMGIAATATSITQQFHLWHTAQGYQRLRLAMAGVRVMLWQGVMAARAFTVALLANPIFWVVGAVVALGAAFVWAWRNSEQFRNKVLESLEPISKAWEQLKQSLRTLGNVLLNIPFVQTIADWIQKLGGFQSFWDGLLNTLAYGIGFFFGFTITVFSKIVTSIIKHIDKLVNQWRVVKTVALVTWDSITQYIQTAITFWNTVLTDFFGWITGVWDKAIAQPASKVWETVKGSAKRALDWIFDKLTAIGKFFGKLGFGDGASNWFTDMKNKGRDAVLGAATGITSHTNLVNNASQKMAHGSVAAVQNTLQIRSPSRVFMGIGGYIGEGLSLGIGNSAQNAINAAKDMSKGVLLAGSIGAAGLALATPSITAPKGLNTPALTMPAAKSIDAGTVGLALGTPSITVPKGLNTPALATPKLQQRETSLKNETKTRDARGKRTFEGATFNFTIENGSGNAEDLMQQFVSLLEGFQ